MGKQLFERIKYWSQLFLLPVYGLSFLFPRNKKIWLFGSTFGKRFADNPRYLYLYLREYKKPDVRPIWITHSREVMLMLEKNNCEVYHYHSIKGIWYCLRGSTYIFDNYSKDISFWLSGGAIKINLWHGTGNKKANHDNLFDRVRHPKNQWEKFLTFPRRISDEKPNHYTLATSKPLALITASAFNTPLSHVIVGGYPRNDAMLNPKFPHIYTNEENDILQRIQTWKLEGKVINLYMPTFRDSEHDFFRVMRLKEFNYFLIQENMIWIIKLHPKSKLHTEFKKIAYSNIIIIDASIDTYTFLSYVDIMTADYSSVYSDYMLLDRPVVCFYYDYEQYISNTRDSYIPFTEYMPELKAMNMEELMMITRQALLEDSCKTLRKQSRDRMFLYQDASAAERLYDKISAILQHKV